MRCGWLHYRVSTSRSASYQDLCRIRRPQTSFHMMNQYPCLPPDQKIKNCLLNLAPWSLPLIKNAVPSGAHFIDIVHLCAGSAISHRLHHHLHLSDASTNSCFYSRTILPLRRPRKHRISCTYKYPSSTIN